jgi:hypothetical protein
MSYRDDEQALGHALDAVHALLHAESRRRREAEINGSSRALDSNEHALHSTCPAASSIQSKSKKIISSVAPCLLYLLAIWIGIWLVDLNTLKEAGWFSWLTMGFGAVAVALSLIYAFHRPAAIFPLAVSTTVLVLLSGLAGLFFFMNRTIESVSGDRQSLTISLTILFEANRNMQLALPIVSFNALLLSIGRWVSNQSSLIYTTLKGSTRTGPQGRIEIIIGVHLVFLGIVYLALVQHHLPSVPFSWAFLVLVMGVLSVGLGLICVCGRPRLMPLAVGAVILVLLFGLMGLHFDLSDAAYEQMWRGADRLWRQYDIFLNACGAMRWALPFAFLDVLFLGLAGYRFRRRSNSRERNVGATCREPPVSASTGSFI